MVNSFQNKKIDCALLLKGKRERERDPERKKSSLKNLKKEERNKAFSNSFENIKYRFCFESRRGKKVSKNNRSCFLIL